MSWSANPKLPRSRQPMKTFIRSLLTLSVSLGASLASASPDWQTVIPASDPLLTNAAGQLIDEQGALLTDRAGEPLPPKCALANLDPRPPVAQFKFFVQAGDPSKLVVFHTGGGACWNNLTCASSLGGARGTYSAVITETPESLKYAGGILDGDAPANPFAGWTKVYIPYCTGDVGWGNRDADYSVPGFGPVPISHRGYANVRAVTEWLQRRFHAEGTPSKILVAGSSAGGYAAIGTLFPEVAAVAGSRTDFYVIGDSANGIVTDEFLQTARGNWGIDATLPGYVLSAIDPGAAGLSTRVYANSARTYRQVRFGQYQNAFDLNQAQIFNIMKNPDNPLLWTDESAITAALMEWTVAMRANTLATALNPGYRFYTAAGYEHTVLINIGPEAGLGFVSDDFYSESSARALTGPVAFRDWANDMVNKKGILWRTGDWKNATCFPNCNVQ